VAHKEREVRIDSGCKKDEDLSASGSERASTRPHAKLRNVYTTKTVKMKVFYNGMSWIKSKKIEEVTSRCGWSGSGCRAS